MLGKENRLLRKENARLVKENTELKNRIIELEHKKTSGNSSKPPSSDISRPHRNVSLRDKSTKKSGGQKGHKGKTLKMVETPDEVIYHIPQYCTVCGTSLSGQKEQFKERRQVIDIPPIMPVITEHRTYSIQCNCGHCTQGVFPEEVKNHVNYGNRITSLIAYLISYQYISWNRIASFFEQVFQVSLSEGTIGNKLKSFTHKCEPIYNEIKRRVQTGNCVGADETSCKVNGKKHWIWTWQTRHLTYIVNSVTRGYQTVVDNFEQGFPQSILVHDCLSAQLKTPAKDHQICIAHLLRELKYSIEKRNSIWAYKFYQILAKALKVKHRYGQKGYEKQVNQIIHNVNILLEWPINTEDKKLKAFRKRMIKHQKYLFPFLYYEYVPPDNNASERAIRNVKVKQKVSGFFKTSKGADQFVMIRSVIDTCLKNNGNVFDALCIIPNLATE